MLWLPAHAEVIDDMERLRVDDVNGVALRCLERRSVREIANRSAQLSGCGFGVNVAREEAGGMPGKAVPEERQPRAAKTWDDKRSRRQEDRATEFLLCRRFLNYRDQLKADAH